MLSCNALKKILFASALLLVLGGGLIFLAPFTDPAKTSLTLVINSIGIGCVLVAAALLAGTTLLALLPGSRRRLEACNH